MSGPRRIEPVERAHLRDAAGYAPPIYRYTPSPDLAGLVRRYWLPVWSLPPRRRSVQRVLQYPVCLLVITDAEARLVGPVTGLSTQELVGTGWAVGTMLQPAAGNPLLGGPVTELTDRSVDLRTLAGLDGIALEEAVREAAGDDPSDGQRQRAAIAAIEAALAPLLPVDEEGALVNAIVQHVEGDPTVQRVSQLCDRFGVTERTLQRLTARRVGLSPKWLIQRRRLHEAAERLRAAPDGRRPGLARVAAELGYADQGHFGRDFRSVTGLTPRQFASEPRPERWRQPADG